MAFNAHIVLVVFVVVGVQTLTPGRAFLLIFVLCSCAGHGFQASAQARQLAPSWLPSEQWQELETLTRELNCTLQYSTLVLSSQQQANSFTYSFMPPLNIA